MFCKDFRFLVVEDHDVQRRIAVRRLQTWGARTVHQAACGAEALRILRDPSAFVDVVLLDLSMPQTDGVALAGQVNACASPPAIILHSALNAALLDQVVGMLSARQVRLAGVIAKPMTEAKLAPLLDMLLQGPGSRWADTRMAA